MQPNTTIKCKGLDIHIGITPDEIAIISQKTGDIIPFTAIKKGGRLAKIKRKFKIHLCSSQSFCFRMLSKADTLELIQMLK